MSGARWYIRRRASPEKTTQTACRTLLRLRHIPFWDTSQPRAALVTAGLPDLLLFAPRLIFVEVKSPTGRLSPTQRVFQRLCATAGVPYWVVRSAAELAAALDAAP